MLIGIAGIGGIGSNVAVQLVRLGIKNLKIVDYDTIEEKNLSRQFYFYDQIGKYKVDALEENLLRINPELEIKKECLLLNRHNITKTFNDCDIIVEGFDKAKNKIELLEFFSNTSKLIVSACGVAGPDLKDVITKKIGDNVIVVGDFHTDVSESPLYIHKIYYITSLMVESIMDYIKKSQN